jgi:hypothetical protein
MNTMILDTKHLHVNLMALLTLERILFVKRLANPIVAEDMIRLLLFHAKSSFPPQRQLFLSKQRARVNYMLKGRVKNQNNIATVEMTEIERKTLSAREKTEIEIEEKRNGNGNKEEKAVQERAKKRNRSGSGVVQRSVTKRNEI